MTTYKSTIRLTPELAARIWWRRARREPGPVFPSRHWQRPNGAAYRNAATLWYASYAAATLALLLWLL